MSEDRPNEEVVQKEWIALIRVEVHSQEIESGYDLHNWDDRKEADIETVDHQLGFKQLTAGSLDELEDDISNINALEVVASE